MGKDLNWVIVGDHSATGGYVKEKLKELVRNAEASAFSGQAASLPHLIGQIEIFTAKSQRTQRNLSLSFVAETTTNDNPHASGSGMEKFSAQRTLRLEGPRRSLGVRGDRKTGVEQPWDEVLPGHLSRKHLRLLQPMAATGADRHSPYFWNQEIRIAC